MVRGFFAVTAVAFGALLMLGRAGSGASARFAQAPESSGDPGGELPVNPFESRGCPKTRELRGASWRGYLRADSGSRVHELCGQRGAWSYFRARPQAGGLQVHWDSQKPVAVAIGWGACDSEARFCAKGGSQLIANWPEAASLWIAVLDPAAPEPSDKDNAADASSGEDASDGSDSSAGSSEAAPYPGVLLELGWRAH